MHYPGMVEMAFFDMKYWLQSSPKFASGEIMKKNKFTLFELMVVVAMISVLITILLPSLRDARLASKTALSMNNLKQIYRASSIYASNNDGYLFTASHNIHPTRSDDSMNWPRIAYETMTGEMLSLNDAAVWEMENGPYAEVMFCPVLRETRGPADSGRQSHGDYSLNRHFTSEYRKIARLEGKIEPFMAPTTAKTFTRAQPQLNRGTYDPNTQGHMVYEYSNSKTIASFIDGRVTFISIPEGDAISGNIWNINNFR